MEMKEMWSVAEPFDTNNNFFISGEKLEVIGPEYEYPFNSSQMNIYKLQAEDAKKSREQAGNETERNEVKSVSFEHLWTTSKAIKRKCSIEYDV